jgi:hypothetical protein
MYTFTEDIPIGQVYKVQYTIITNNNLIAHSLKYRIAQKHSIDPEINASLIVNLNYDNGYISIDLKSKAD